MNVNIKSLIESEEDDKELFVNKVDSKLSMDISKNQIIDDDEWIEMVHFTIPHLEKAFNKWNKQIVTEEEVIKIELIKKVSVESIKHLSKNTNFIAEMDEETGDVTPSKILNAYKEESFITYENRFLYTLVSLIDTFIFLRSRNDENEQDYKGKNYQKATYEGKTKIGKEKIKLNFEYVSEKEEKQGKSNELEIKISEIKKTMKTIKAMELYKLLDAKKVTPVKSPLKMTNVLLKNVNFQYCVKLWGYLNSHLDDSTNAVKTEKKYEEKGLTKDLIDEDFFIKYIIFNKVNLQTMESNKLKNSILDPKERRELTDRLIEKLIEINPEITDQELKQMIADKYMAYRNKKYISLKPLEDKFNRCIKDYLEKIEKLRIKKV